MPRSSSTCRSELCTSTMSSVGRSDEPCCSSVIMRWSVLHLRHAGNRPYRAVAHPALRDTSIELRHDQQRAQPKEHRTDRPVHENVEMPVGDCQGIAEILLHARSKYEAEQ